MEKCSFGNVMAAQAYILFYTQINRPRLHSTLSVIDNTGVPDSEGDTLEYSMEMEDLSDHAQEDVVNEHAQKAARNEHAQQGAVSDHDPEEVTQKRGRGRPRKYPLGLGHSSEDSPQNVSQKRGRGRPRKYGIGLGGSAQELEDGEISFNFKNSLVPTYVGSKRAAESAEDRRKHLKRRKTVMW